MDSRPSKRIVWLLLLVVIFLVGCGSSKTYAPVINVWQQPATTRNSYVVQKGDTLYSIAWAYGWDYRKLATSNRLKPPYRLHRGQRLYFVKMAPEARPKVKVKPIQAVKINRWLWPVRGKIVGRFSLKHGGNRGLNISGKFGTPIRASAAGLVVYSGSGLRSYGELIIIKHNADFLSAYAHNSKILVKEGEQVAAGQVIARMGRTNGGRILLHFEIRRNGRPKNPLRYLS